MARGGFTTEQVRLFATCLVDTFRPEVAIAAVHVLERNGVRVEFPEEQTCCGQFAFNAGYHHEAAMLARHFIEVFETSDSDIVALSGSCVAMVVHDYAQLVREDALAHGASEAESTAWEHRAQHTADRIWELTQWLIRQMDDSQSKDKSTVMALHQGCHMRRVLKANTEPRAVLEHSGIDVMELEDADQCCGFGGTYSMTEWPVSTALADAKIGALLKAQDAGATALTSADLGCLLHLEGRLSRLNKIFPVMHVAEVLDSSGRTPPGTGRG